MTQALVKATLWGLILIAATTAAAAELWVVQNERVAVTFTAETHGAVTSLVDKATGRELAARQPRPQLFQLEFSTPGSSQRLTVSNSDANGVEFTERDPAGGGTLRFARLASHPPGPGPWATDVFRRQLQTMLQECRKIQPGAVVCFEEPNEHFLQEVGLQDYRDWEVVRRADADPASVFNYLYHEYLPTFQSNPQAGNRHQAAYCLVTGQIPHLVPSFQTGPGPLLAGGDFEKWLGPVPAGWDKVAGYQGRAYSGQTGRDESERHNGQSSLRLTNQGQDEISQVSQNVVAGQTFVAGRNYQLGAWIKTQGLKQGNAILLGAFALEMKNLGSWRLEMPAEREGWVHRQSRFTLPEGTQLLRIMLHLQGPGTAWIDDVKLEQVLDEGRAAEVQRPQTPGDHDFMRQWVQLFHGEGRPYLMLGKMIHPPRLDVGLTEVQNRRFPAILHEAFAAPDGTRAAILVNASDGPQTGTLYIGGQATSVRRKADRLLDV